LSRLHHVNFYELSFENIWAILQPQGYRLHRLQPQHTYWYKKSHTNVFFYLTGIKALDFVAWLPVCVWGMGRRERRGTWTAKCTTAAFCKQFSVPLLSEVYSSLPGASIMRYFDTFYQETMIILNERISRKHYSF
jgi:hypothetical protein